MLFKKTLKLYITKMFFIIILILSILLISLNYENTKKLNTIVGKERIEQNAEKIKLIYRELTSSIHVLLNTFVDSKLQNDHNAIIDATLLKSVGSVLKNNAIINSLYVGYSDNNSASIRTIPQNIKKTYMIPKNASLQVDIYTNLGNKLTKYYFDDSYKLISRTYHDQAFYPTQRPWFINTKSNDKIYLTPPYKYKLSDKYGITFSKKMENNSNVIAVDITLESLKYFIDSLDLFDFYHSSKLIIFDSNNNIIFQKGFILNEQKNSLLQIIHNNKKSTEQFKIKYLQNFWWVKSIFISKVDEQNLTLIIAIPEKELLGDAYKAINNQIAYAILVLILGTVLIFIVSEKIVAPLKQFTHLANTFSNLNFKGIKIPKSNIKEINELANAFTLVANTIDHFLITLTLVSSTNNLYALLQSIVEQCKDNANADFALLWSEDEKLKNHIKLAAHSPNATHALSIKYQELIKDLPKLEKSMLKNQPFLFSPSEHEFVHCDLPKELKRAWVIPMVNRHNAYVGCIMLGFHHSLAEEKEGKVHFLHAFLGFISLIHENWAHIYEQKQFFHSLIEMMASAIDTKSPYTGGHCQRVPELAFMLAKATHLDEKYHSKFTLDEKSLEALHLAAWLHDCGKVTTPEFVIDKATKLETLFNRIHEIRTRFEVIKRDIKITYWQQRVENKKDHKELDQWLEKELTQLDDEFAFIAKMNQGETEVSQEDITRLHKIASRTWYRTLDDSIGISWEEQLRLKHRPASMLPQKEYLLKDSIEQKIPWSKVQQDQFNNWSFQLQPSSLQFNKGEIHNLSVLKGTLTKEERFIIKDHIVQTINMLSKLHYPDHLSRIPEIAGGHHERLDGKGYPMGLNGSSFSVDARIIAVADIFEALTARDRPYKSLKTVNESLTILAKMAKERHIDEGLFRIFVEQKVYLEYAERFLTAEQCDEVDEKAIFALLD